MESLEKRINVLDDRTKENTQYEKKRANKLEFTNSLADNFTFSFSFWYH